MHYFIACLSPDDISRNITIANMALGLTCVLIMIQSVLDFRARIYRWLVVYGLFLAIHPVWTISAYKGDCGAAKQFFAVAIFLIFLCLLAFRVVQPNLRVRSFLLCLTLFCWVNVVGDRLYRYFWDHPILVRLNDNPLFLWVTRSFAFASELFNAIAVATTVICVSVYLGALAIRLRRARLARVFP